MKIGQEMLSQLRKIRTNLISWYPFDENDEILEISYFDENISVDVCKNVTFIKELQDIPEGAMFDYILLEGILENSREKFNIEPEKLIERIKEHLKNNGKLLIATDNKIGIYNLCSEHKEITTGYMGKKALEKMLDNQGFISRKFYYPLPNYLTPNVIFTDNHLPDLETINRNLTFYDDNTLIILNETNRFRKIIEVDENEFKNLTNSFFIECSMQQFDENNIEFVAFSNMRKPQYRIKTVIQGDKVYKENVDEEAHKHIDNIKKNIDIMKQSNINTVDSYDTNRIISDYQQNAKTYDEVILQEIRNDKIEKAIELIIKFKDKLIYCLEKTDKNQSVFDKYKIEYTENDLENLHFVKHGLWDLIFKNCFYIDNEFLFYDQEWRENNIPAEFIIYRAIKYLDGIKKHASKNELFEKIGINNSQVKIFDKLDDILQEQIRDSEMWNLHLVSETQKNVEEKIKKLNDDKEKILNECRTLLNQKDARINNLENGMKEAIETVKNQEQKIQVQGQKIIETEQTLNAITNSTSWKITEPLRKLKSKRTDK